MSHPPPPPSRRASASGCGWVQGGFGETVLYRSPWDDYNGGSMISSINEGNNDNNNNHKAGGEPVSMESRAGLEVMGSLNPPVSEAGVAVRGGQSWCGRAREGSPAGTQRWAVSGMGWHGRHSPSPARRLLSLHTLTSFLHLHFILPVPLQPKAGHLLIQLSARLVLPRRPPPGALFLGTMAIPVLLCPSREFNFTRRWYFHR